MEEHFKNKLKNHKVDWDKETLLGNMQKELSQKKSRFNRRWFWLLPLLLIGTCWGVSDIGFFIGNGTELDHTISNDINSKIEDSEVDAYDVNQPDEKSETVSNTIASNADKNQLDKTNPSSLSENNELKIGTSKDIESAKPTVNSKSNFIKNDATIFSNQRALVFDYGVSQSINSKKSLTQFNNNSANLNSNNLNHSTNRAARKKTNLIAVLPTLEMEELPFDWEMKLNLTTPQLKPEEAKEIKKVIDRKNYFFASTAGEIGLINRTTQLGDFEPGFPDEVKKNEDAVTSRFLLSTNLSVGYQHQSGWSLQSGLEYNRVVEFFDFEDSLNVSFTNILNEKAFYFVTQNADTLFFSDSVALENSEIRKIKHNNFHSYFNVPIEVGYRHSFGKMNVFGTVGMSYAFAHTYKGRERRLIDDENMEVIDNPKFYFKNRIGVQFSCGAEYPLFQQSSVFMKMAYRRSPKLVTGATKFQFYNAYSLGVGLRVRLGSK